MIHERKAAAAGDEAQAGRPQSHHGAFWNMLGSGMVAANSVLLTMFVGHRFAIDTMGAFTLALTTAQILYTLALFGANDLQMTDYAQVYPFRTYAALRVCTMAAAFIAALVSAGSLHFGPAARTYTLLLTAFMALNAFAELYQSRFFQCDRLDLSGRSLFFRYLLSTAAFGAAILAGASIELSSSLMLLVNLAATWWWDLRIRKMYGAVLSNSPADDYGRDAAGGQDRKIAAESEITKPSMALPRKTEMKGAVQSESAQPCMALSRKTEMKEPAQNEIAQPCTDLLRKTEMKGAVQSESAQPCMALSRKTEMKEPAQNESAQPCTDLPRGAEPESPQTYSGGSRIKSLFLEALPLALSVLGYQVIINMPRYLINLYLDEAAQGIYHLLFLPAYVVNLMSQFIFKPYLHTLSDLLMEDHGKARKHVLRLLGLIASGTALLPLIMRFLGPPVMKLFFGQDITPWNTQQCLFAASGGILAANQLLYYLRVIERRQKRILAAYLAGAAAAAALGVLLIPGKGIDGAWISFTAGQTVILAGLV